MPDYPRVILDALVAELLLSFAPSILADDAVCRRAASNPGLAAAQRLLADWLAELKIGDHIATLQPARLEAVLRGLLVRAIARGSIEVGGHPCHGGPVLLLDPQDMAALEIVREIAVTLDAIASTTVAATHDTHRKWMIDRVLGMAVAAVDRTGR
jgi:hypothetical protein